MRTLFLTDTHGQYTKTQKLLAEVNYDSEKDTLVLGGDYFDRGHENDEIASWLETLVDNENVHFLIGNHDLALISLLTQEKFNKANYQEIEFMRTHNGLDKTITQLTQLSESILANMSYYEIRDRILSRHPRLVDVYNKATFYYEENDTIYTHSVLPRNYTTASREEWVEAVWDNPRIWSRITEFIDELDNKHIYIGHYSKSNFDELVNMNEEVKFGRVTFCDGGLAWGREGMIHVRNGGDEQC